ncbi:MAG: hypothetical protein GF313_09445, partial [Caldithrix sp.]|nr:hypothetical protein [Caldithrix sp.]
MKYLSFMIIVVMAFSLSAADLEKEKHLTLDKGNLTSLEIDCGAGYLYVNGIEQSNV